MRLVNALTVYVLTNYLKFFVLVSPLCSLWQYYDSARHTHIVLSELVLVLVIAALMSGSLALARMDCNRISNYFTLPVLLGVAYLNLTHYHRETLLLANKPPVSAQEDDQRTPDSATQPATESGSQADGVELFLCNRLAAMSLALMTTNAFGKQIDKIIS